MGNFGSVSISWKRGDEAPDVCIHHPEYVLHQHIKGGKNTRPFSVVTLDADGVPVRLFLDPDMARRVAEAFGAEVETEEQA